MKVTILDKSVELVPDSGSYYADAIITVRNDGTVPAYLNEYNVSIDFENEAGEIVASTEYCNVTPPIITPGEKAYITVDTADVNDAPKNEKLKIIPKIMMMGTVLAFPCQKL
jgi:hypothetical protein